MRYYEYRVIPAPQKGRKARGVKGPQERFANALETIMNEQGQDGWRYVRTDTLPCEERKGLTRRSTVYQNMLVFSREIGGADQSRTEKAIEQQAETVMAEPTELWRQTETDAAKDALVLESETNHAVEKTPGEAQDEIRLGGVTRGSDAER